MSYLIDFLRGSKSEKIRDEHKNIKTYGVGADISKDAWFNYFKDLIAQNYLAQTDGDYPTLKLTEKSMDVLAGNTAVELIKVKVKEEKRSKLVADAVHPYEHELFDDLRRLRTTFAKHENVPPYVIFSDATLIEMATYLPQNDWELRKISGVGDLKFDKYGADFLAEIKSYCVKNSLVSRIDLKSKKREKKVRTKRGVVGKDTYHTSLDLYRDGKSISEIAKERGLSPTTIENHLIRFIATGEISLEQFVSLDKVETIQKAIIKFRPSDALSPVKEFLGDEYSFAEIRAVKATL